MPHVKESFDWFNDNAARLKKLARDPKTFLYVGVRHDMRSWWHDRLCKDLGIQSASALEIYGPNADVFERTVVDAAHQLRDDYKLVRRVIRGDVRQLNTLTRPGEFDVVFWDHGPEHVAEEDLRLATPMLQGMIGRMLIYCGPWGTWPQGPEGGNCDEEHKCVLHPQLMEELGMTETVTFNGYGQEHNGELVSIWVNNG